MGMAGKPGRGRRDAVDWLPYLQLYEAGMRAAEIAEKTGLTRQTVYVRLGALRKLDDQSKLALREEALRRTRVRADTELFLGNPLKASRLAAATIALRKAMQAELQSREMMVDPEDEPSADDAEELEALRAEIRRKYVERALVYRKHAQIQGGLGSADRPADGGTAAVVPPSGPDRAAR